jgi:hypothetical protein
MTFVRATFFGMTNPPSGITAIAIPTGMERTANTAVVRGTSKDGKKVVLEILDSVGTNPKVRFAKSYKKPSDLLKSSTQRTMKPEHGKVSFSKPCSGPDYDMAEFFRRKQGLETAEYIRKLRMDGDPMMMALDKDTAKEPRMSDNDRARPIQCSEPTPL